MRRDARCPLRRGEPCTLCVPGATGPADCPTVYLVMSDPDLRDQLHTFQRGAQDVNTPQPRGGS
ncbi:DUF6767 domain-containing protein [Dactylosporangium sp. CA-139114]|uniref:DUF6767 domain-containing protein n=1 Tax=Dactylosporangium sp. CA-139114 TaxID=3239931 RepID=UPI003D979B98